MLDRAWKFLGQAVQRTQKQEAVSFLFFLKTFWDTAKPAMTEATDTASRQC